MSEKKSLEDLFDKFLNHTITEQELDEFLWYIKVSNSESKVKALMDEHWDKNKDKWFDDEERLQEKNRFVAILDKIDQRSKDREIILDRSETIKRSIKVKFAIAASILFLLSIISYYVFNTARVDVLAQVDQTNMEIFSGKQFIRLPDGSTLVMNEGSDLTYNSDFGIVNREVHFTGEGYFDIVHNPDKPFIVYTGEVKTTVLGTAFNVHGYEDEAEVRVTVARGKVAVGHEDGKFENILPEQQLNVNKETKQYKKEKVNLKETLSWKENFLILDRMTIEEAVKLIGHRFQVNIKLENEDIIQCTINAAFLENESLDQVLRVVCGVLQADFKIDDNQVIISGGRECI